METLMVQDRISLSKVRCQEYIRYQQVDTQIVSPRISGMSQVLVIPSRHTMTVLK